ncbi:tetratricopeptide repeat 1 [Chlorella sorokiniana]|uniref:Tetratricopeptide repeat 1 n=1 Tax=Chlorella sorokiniana TaxID=3076 RepID=A0A2P6TU71_CHLSO|nr:tetratricopeptide repeat 1 [Chlorella sorokiniana]|eukprot:PRW57622.1 tetratricopeptide repeat 1 [Chlorella sorokiniana]
MSCAKLQPAPALPPGCEGTGKPHVEELFEHRWRKAYEVRALERESWHARSQLPASGAEGLLDDEEEEEEEDAEPEIKLVWDSSSRRPGAASAPAVAAEALPPGAAAAAELKERGNALLKAGDCAAAVKCYTEALAALRTASQQGGSSAGQAAAAGAAAAGGAAAAAAPEPEAQLAATLHSNRAHALMQLQRFEPAVVDAQRAHRLLPSWPKPLYRLAQAQLALGRWEEAVATCNKGHALAPQSSEGKSEFTPLLDTVAVTAARAGSLAGYDGMQLEVRSAGEEAWLCQPAPHVPELDGPEEEDDDPHGVVTTLPALPDSAGAGVAAASSGGSSSGGAKHAASGALVSSSSGHGAAGAAVDPLVAWDYRQVAAAAAAARRRTSFRSVLEAVTAARDGDRIILRRGIHNGMGQCITLDKRLLIEGEGALGEASIDQRANVPTFRIQRGGVVLRNLDLDHTGFREALLVDGPTTVTPLIQSCNIKCSGDDAINTSGEAAPTFVRCTITGKKVGLHAYGSSNPRLEVCAFEKCGAQGVHAQDSAAPALLGCVVAECEEEAVVGMDSTRLLLHSCTLRGCKGPGVDLSNTAHATIVGGAIAGCVGGVWAWGSSHAALHSAAVAGGPSHALLVDGSAAVEARDCTVQGLVHATEAAWQGILHPSNKLLDPECPTDFPPEVGPFVFEPNPFTRKQ